MQNNRAYLNQLKHSESYLDALSSNTASTLDLLASLSKSFQNVEAQTTAFQGQCESLIAEQERLKCLADDVRENLQYYSYLEPITKRLNAPGAGNFVRGEEFSNMLERLDECLEYMTAHVCYSRVSVCINLWLIISALPTRSTYLSFTLSFTLDKRFDTYTCSLCWCFTGDFPRCNSQDR